VRTGTCKKCGTRLFGPSVRGCLGKTLRPPVNPYAGNFRCPSLSNAPAELGNVRRDLPCLIEGQDHSDVSLIGCLASVDVDEGLAGCVQHLEATPVSARCAMAVGNGVV
jgi:hypothetical protein